MDKLENAISQQIDTDSKREIWEWINEELCNDDNFDVPNYRKEGK